MNQSYKIINEEYVYWLDTLGFSDSLIYDYKFRVRDFLEWLELQNIVSINLLTNKQLNHYFDYLQIRPNKRRKGGLSVAHLNHNFMAIDKLLEFLHQMDVTTAPPPTNFRITPDKQTRINNIQPFTQEEVKELIHQIPNTYLHFPLQKREEKQEQLKLIFVLYYACGLRRTEGYNLTVNDIDFERRTLFVKQGKNYKDRIIPMNERIYKAIEHYIYDFRNLQKPKHKRLFLSTTGTLNNSLQDLLKQTSINKRITLHILRHSIATHLLQNGMSIENISRFLGHSSLDSTQIYTHIINR